AGAKAGEQAQKPPGRHEKGGGDGKEGDHGKRDPPATAAKPGRGGTGGRAGGQAAGARGTPKPGAARWATTEARDAGRA
ncbi:hypothetical protein C3R44_24265, partial [Mycobacterium tuberculosis]